MGTSKIPGIAGRGLSETPLRIEYRNIDRQQPVSLPSATMPGRAETQRSEGCIAAPAIVAGVEPHAEESLSEPEFPSDFYKSNPFRCGDEGCFRCNDPKRVSCNDPQRLDVAKPEAKDEQAKQPAAGSGGGSKPEEKPVAKPVVMPKSNAEEWNPNNNGWDEAPIEVGDWAPDWVPENNSWDESPPHTVEPDSGKQERTEGTGGPVPKTEEPIPELRNFKMRMNPRPLCDLAELERMNPVNSNRPYRAKWRGVSPRRSQGGFGAPRPRQSPVEHNPFSGEGFGNPSSSGFEAPASPNERGDSPQRNRIRPRRRARNSGRPVRFTEEQADIVSDIFSDVSNVLAEATRKLRLSW